MTDTTPSRDSRDQVLVVEDDAAQRLGLQQLLKTWGYAVEVASDGEAALQTIATLRPAIVLTDPADYEGEDPHVVEVSGGPSTPSSTLELPSSGLIQPEDQILKG